MIKGRNVVVLSETYIPTENLKRFMERVCGLKFRPVQGKDDAYWVTGETEGDYIDGPKYYKMVFGFVTEERFTNKGKVVTEGYGFDLQASGDYNAWSLLGQYKRTIKKFIVEKREQKETA